MNVKTPDYDIADYGDFEVHLNQRGTAIKGFTLAAQHIEQKYIKKEAMVNSGVLSENAAEKIATEKLHDLVKAYTDHIIVGWKGKLRGEELPEYGTQACIELLTKPENSMLFSDLVDHCANTAVEHRQAEVAAAKN